MLRRIERGVRMPKVTVGFAERYVSRDARKVIKWLRDV
jgi:hypothetical protein